MISSDIPVILSSLVEKGGGAIPLSISIKEDEEVQRLKAENEQLLSRIHQLQQQVNRTEYLFRCESTLNNNLVDLCRQHGIKIDKAFFNRPYSE